MSEIKTVYAVGVGPGDSQLLTLKAVSVLKKVKTVFVPQASEKSASLALEIIQPFVQVKKVKKLFFPMTKDQELLKAKWAEAAQALLATLNRENEVAFVTLGDPSMYSTFTYLQQMLMQEADKAGLLLNFEIIPGISSVQQAAAKLKLPLVSGDKSMAVISGANLNYLEELIKSCQTVVVMKAALHLDKIQALIKKLNCQAYLVKRAGLEGEEVLDLHRECLPNANHYLSLVVIKNKR